MTLNIMLPRTKKFTSQGDPPRTITPLTSETPQGVLRLQAIAGLFADAVSAVLRRLETRGSDTYFGL
jgi:hypothetical protein